MKSAGGASRRAMQRGNIQTFAVVAVVVMTAAITVMASSGFTHDQKAETYLDRSVPFIGIETPRLESIDGKGIRIAVIDTGVDYEHPDMFGWQDPGGKVAGGYNHIWDEESPRDTDGHGTQVAGVAAADGSLQGVAPRAEILAYKVSEEGSNVSSDLIADAIARAVEDGADIINISMGVDRKNTVIEDAINMALARGVLVVVAAGNNGPEYSTIGSPGRSMGAVSVGATYNNLTSSLVATLDVGDGQSYTVIPMVDTVSLAEPIDAILVPAGYAKESDFEGINVTGAIAVAERGSDIEDDLLYFSLKEKHAADAGARALIIYNNIDGIFLGELLHEFTEPEYAPRIPVVSMDRDEGLDLLESVENGTAAGALLHLFHNPDFVAHFSSRGPVSPFYIKPDIVAPGAYINTTDVNSKYSIMSGTSYAAPHVSGTAALLLQKHPNLDRHELKSVLMITSDRVSDAYGDSLSIHETGAGRLNITRAYEADIAVLPPSFVASTSPQVPSAEASFEVRQISNSTDKMYSSPEVRFEGPDFARFAHVFDRDSGMLRIKISVPPMPEPDSLSGPNSDTEKSTDDAPASGDASKNHTSGGSYGEHEGRVILEYDGSEYAVPFLLHHTRGSISAEIVNYDGKKTDNDAAQIKHMLFDVAHPDGWEFVKIDIIDSITEETVTVTGTPDDIHDVELEIRKNGTYWVDARIMSGGISHAAYDIAHVRSSGGADGFVRGYDMPDVDWVEYNSETKSAFAAFEFLPVRQIIIISCIIAAIGAAGVVFQIKRKGAVRYSINEW